MNTLPTNTQRRALLKGAATLAALPLACALATSARIASAWRVAQQPWIVPIPGTTHVTHLLNNLGAGQVIFSAGELRTLNAAAAAVAVQGGRLLPALQAYSGAEAPLRQRSIPVAQRITQHGERRR